LSADPALPFVEQQLGATDPDGDTLVYELVSPTQGTGYDEAFVSPNSGRLYLTLTAGFTGHLDLSYHASDGQLFSDAAGVAIDVQPPAEEVPGLGSLELPPEVYASFPHTSYEGVLLGLPGEAATMEPA